MIFEGNIQAKIQDINIQTVYIVRFFGITEEYHRSYLLCTKGMSEWKNRQISNPQKIGATHYG